MKVLLDENLPKTLKKDFPEHEIYTVRDKGLNSKKNGELIRLMLDEGFDTLITFDQNVQHQQNLDKYPIHFNCPESANKYLCGTLEVHPENSTGFIKQI